MRIAMILMVASMVTVRAHGAVSVGNQALTLTVDVQEGQYRLLSLTNHLTRTEHMIEDQGFRIQTDGGTTWGPGDFKVVSAPVEGGDARRSASWTLSGNDGRFKIKLTWEAVGEKPWLRQSMEIINDERMPLTVRWIDAGRLRIENEKVTWSANPAFRTLTDYGQPVFLNSLWLGMEHPAAHTSADDEGWITLRHHPGRELQHRESLQVKPVVIGAAGMEGVREAFARYVDDLRYYDGPPRVFFWWNGFRVIKPPNRVEQGVRMAEYMIEKLQKPYGHVFDGFSYDAGFNMYRPDALFVPNEEGIWEKTNEVLEESSTELGFWTSFSCIYDTPTHAWGKTQGFGLQHGQAYCLAEPTYRKAITKRLLEIVETYDMKVISFDGMHLNQGYGCNEPGHGHLVGEGPEAGKFGTEAVVDAELDIFERIRAIQPDINLDFFVCGEWASPWWLTHMDGVHTVPGDTVGCDFPSPALRDELITARDIQAFDLYKKRGVPFPLYASDLYGFQVRGDHLIDGVQAFNEDYPEKWENEYVLAFAGRGTITSFISCSDLMLLGGTRTGMKFLAGVEDYVRNHHAIYQRTTIIGGAPGKGEVIGYAHGDGHGRSLLALHNPTIETKRFALALDDALELGAEGDRFAVDMIYPHRLALGTHQRGAKVDIEMNGFEVVMLDVRRENRRIFDFFPAAPEAMPPDPQFTGAAREDAILQALYSLDRAWREPELLVYLRSSEKIEGEPAVRAEGSALDGVVRRRSRRGREELWWIGKLERHEGRFVVELPSGFTGQSGTWLRATCPPPPALDAMPSLQEAFMPMLPEDARQRYWSVHPWRP